jgi:lipopolysaccharide export system permease protein
MVLKRIDRYVSLSFLTRFLGTLCLVGALYATFDLLKRLEDIGQAEGGQSLATVARYYANVLPIFLLDIVPGIVLVASGLVMVHMAKTRELLALKASGTSLYRAMAPLFFWTILISGGMLGVRETFGPRLARQGEILGRVLDNDVSSHLLVSDPAHNRRAFIGEYDFSRRTMKSVCVIDCYPSGTLKRNIEADSARLRESGVLELRTAEVQEFDPSGTPTARPTLVPRMEVEFGLSQMGLVEAAEDNAQKGMALQTLGELQTQMALNPEVPFFRVSYHSRLASFFEPLILLLAGLPCLVGFERSVNSRFLGTIVSIGLAAGLYALTFVFTSMGSTGSLNPVLAGWLPVILSGAVGLWLFQAMLT